MSAEPSVRERRLWAPDLALVDHEPSRFRVRADLVPRLAAIGLLMVLVGAGVGYGIASLAPTVRAARVELLYHLQTDQSADFLRTDRQHDTQLVLIKSRAVLSPVAQEAGIGVDALARKVHASMVGSSEVIRVQVDDRSAGRALDLATAIGARYLDVAKQSETSTARSSLQDEITQLDAQRERLVDTVNEMEEDRLAKGRNGGTIPIPTARERDLSGQIDDLRDRRSELVTRQDELAAQELAQPTAEQVTAPYVLSDPVSPRPARAAAFGAITALVLALVLVAYVVRQQARTDARP